jgi:uncharacterized membrane protein (UPF0127 family)
VLINLTKGKVLAERVEVASSFLKRATGLMFKKSYDGAMIFPIQGRTSFHGFFCNFPILLICLRHHRVICKKILNPWSVVEAEGDTVIELDARREIPVDVGDEVVVLEDSSE